MDLYMIKIFKDGGKELIEIFNRPNIVNKIKRSKLVCVGHACRKQNLMIQRVLQENPMSKRLLGRSMLRWEDGIRKDFLNAREEKKLWRHGLEGSSRKNGRGFVIL